MEYKKLTTVLTTEQKDLIWQTLIKLIEEQENVKITVLGKEKE